MAEGRQYMIEGALDHPIPGIALMITVDAASTCEVTG